MSTDPYPHINREFLIEEYSIKKKSLNTIAQEQNVSRSTIRHRMYIYSIRIRKNIARKRGSLAYKHKVYRKKRIKSDPVYRRYESDARMFRDALSSRRKPGPRNKFWASLPYSVEELKAHLEALFESGMTWDNRARHGWHVDHIQPQSSLPYLTYDDPNFLACWRLSNLRPLWWNENLRKGNRNA